MLKALRATLHLPYFTTRQMATLLAISNAPARIDFSVICRELGIPKSPMSRCIEGLVVLGLVDRRRNEDDRRKVFLGMTAKGWNLIRMMVSP